MTRKISDYSDEQQIILKYYDDGEIHYIEGDLDSYVEAVRCLGGDWECDWQFNEFDDCYDFKVWDDANDDIEAETQLKISGE